MNLICLLGLHGGCKCRIPAPTKAYTTARQSGSTMQVSTYLSNTHSLFILDIKSPQQHQNSCDFSFITVVIASVCSCRSVTSLASCRRWTHHVSLKNGTVSTSVLRDFFLRFLWINFKQSFYSPNPDPPAILLRAEDREFAPRLKTAENANIQPNPGLILRAEPTVTNILKVECLKHDNLLWGMFRNDVVQ